MSRKNYKNLGVSVLETGPGAPSVVSFRGPRYVMNITSISRGKLDTTFPIKALQDAFYKFIDFIKNKAKNQQINNQYLNEMFEQKIDWMVKVSEEIINIE
ncbi:22862_t:CDS:2 [Cetraspora pellucida]|uniref:22862_t:CDS:1 n=1 Tax=Cetraspora pellucida TaxID=1433469 RepID=A0A9N9NHD5_9GLOM|nr:22862_t:CDS:2 [Cetraspora pellucida]